jgi:acyl-coenzyme A synthetase/AMP-(fatty) acid ligase
MVITSDGGFVEIKPLILKEIVDEALEKCPSKKVLAAKELLLDINMLAVDQWLQTAIDQASDNNVAEIMMLKIHYLYCILPVLKTKGYGSYLQQDIWCTRLIL